MGDGAKAWRAQPLAVRLAAAFAAVFAVHYYLLHELLGPLAVDEVYFAHVFWMMRQGLSIYSDFYANHLPTYFYLFQPLLPAAVDNNLDFVWLLRATGLLAVAIHVAMLWTVSRRDFPFLLPALFLFIVFGRMSEVRPDTFGLLLFNAGWWILLRDSSRRSILAAAGLATLALTFSARAGVMAVGMGLLLSYLCWQRRDRRTFAMLCGAAATFVAATAALFLFNERFALMIKLVYFEPLAVMPEVPFWSRWLPIDRLLMVLLIFAGMVGALLRRQDRRSSIVLVACATQLLLILADPSPYQYVYGWATLPALAGLALLADRAPRRLHQGSALIFAVLAALPLALSIGGPTPRAGSIVRVTFDRPIPAEELAEAPTPELMRLATTSARQQGLWNQLALYREICRRLPGPVLTKFYANTICQKDSLYDWAGLKWPPLFEDDPSTASRAEFEKLFAENPPQMVAWGKQFYLPKLNPWGRALLADYDIYEGYALKKQR